MVSRTLGTMIRARRGLVAIAALLALASSCARAPSGSPQHPTSYRRCTWQLQRDEIVRASIDRPGSSWRPALAVDGNDRPLLALASGEVLTSESASSWREVGRLPPAQDFEIAAAADDVWVLGREGAIATTASDAVRIHHRHDGAWQAPIRVNGLARFGRTLAVDGHGVAHTLTIDGRFERLSVASSPDWESDLAVQADVSDPFVLSAGDDDVGIAFATRFAQPGRREGWKLSFVRPGEPAETVHAWDERVTERMAMAMARSEPVIVTERAGDVLGYVRANDTWSERPIATHVPFPSLAEACPSSDPATPCGSSTVHEIADVASGGSAAIVVLVERRVTFERGFINGSGPGPYPPVLGIKSRLGTALVVGVAGAPLAELGRVALARPLGEGETAIAVGPRGLVHVAIYEHIVPEDHSTYQPPRSAVRYLTLACVRT
jgi:hypothetical protein